MTSLSPHTAFKYLGLRMTLTGDTAPEVEYVKAKMHSMNVLINGHPYLPEQMNKVIHMCAHPVLTYSGPMTNWTFSDLLTVEHE